MTEKQEFAFLSWLYLTGECKHEQTVNCLITTTSGKHHKAVICTKCRKIISREQK